MYANVFDAFLLKQGITNDSKVDLGAWMPLEATVGDLDALGSRLHVKVIDPSLMSVYMGITKEASS